MGLYIRTNMLRRPSLTGWPVRLINVGMQLGNKLISPLMWLNLAAHLSCIIPRLNMHITYIVRQ